MEENRDRSTVVDPSLAQLANRIDRKPSSSELRENRLSRPLVVLLAKLLLLLHLLDEGLIAGILFQLRHELGRCPRPTFRPPTGHGKYLRKTCWRRSHPAAARIIPTPRGVGGVVVALIAA